MWSFTLRSILEFPEKDSSPGFRSFPLEVFNEFLQPLLGIGEHDS